MWSHLALCECCERKARWKACETLVFLTTEVGGKAMEELDITTTEVVDYMVGSTMASIEQWFDVVLKQKIPLVLGVRALKGELWT